LNNLSQESKDFLKKMLQYEYNMANSYYHVELKKPDYLHDEEKRKEVQRMMFELKMFVEGL